MIFTGFIHHSQLWKVMQLCNFVVFPSMWEEPSGSVVPEAMASGLAIIMTKSGGMVEYVTENNAIIVEKDEDLIPNLASSMDYLCDNELLCKRMGQVAQEMAQNYDMSVYYFKILEEFRRMKEHENNECE